jgi:hypothetical protein
MEGIPALISTGSTQVCNWLGVVCTVELGSIRPQFVHISESFVLSAVVMLRTRAHTERPHRAHCVEYGCLKSGNPCAPIVM